MCVLIDSEVCFEMEAKQNQDDQEASNFEFKILISKKK